MKILMKILKAIDGVIAKGELWLVIGLFLIMMTMAFFQVILRNFFGISFVWADDLLRHLVLWVGFLGGSLATREDRHINIDALSKVIPDHVKPYVNIVLHMAGAIICILVSIAAFKFIQFEFELGEEITSCRTPVWIFQLVILTTFAFSAYRFLIKALDTTILLVKGAPEEAV